MFVGWVRSMYLGVYMCGGPGEVGKRDAFSAVILNLYFGCFVSSSMCISIN